MKTTDMDKNIIQKIILENQELVEQIELVERHFFFEPHGNYVLVGVRQAGKSYLLYQRMKQLIAKGHQMEELVYINFDDERIANIKTEEMDLIIQAHQALSSTQPILFLDEIHRYSKTQQDALLPHVENGTFYLMGSTTENPSFQVIPALLSRVRVMRLSALDDKNIESIIAKGFHYLKDNYSDAKVQRDIIEMIINFARGDARAALNLVEDLFFASDIKDGVRILTTKRLEELAQTTLIKYSQSDHYDMASAFQKSLRGSDRDAAIYWLAKMITAGEDPRFIARRLIVCAAEDVGNADPNALNVAMNAHRAAELLGMPEARIPLAQAVEYVATAPKSNRAICAVDEAISDIMSGKNYPPPMHLRDAHYKDAGKYGFGIGYVYTHDNPDYKQQFMPDELKDKKYFKE